MAQPGQSSDHAPRFSIIVAVYNDWVLLEGCLQSLKQEAAFPSEVIVVDDGSREPAPEYIQRWSSCYPLTIVRQEHAGISVARNRGVQSAKGSVLLFVDADSRVQAGCLAALASAIEKFPGRSFFQLRLMGDCLGTVGRAEELRLQALQGHLLQPDGHIRYLNTAGFAIRRAALDSGKSLFEPNVLRGEDTLLLANLIQRGDLPWFVPQATVQHTIPISLIQCLRKDIRSAYLEGRTNGIIASKGIRIRMSNWERIKMLRSTWKTSGQGSIGRSAWLVLIARQSLQRTVSLLCRTLRVGTRLDGEISPR